MVEFDAIAYINEPRWQKMSLGLSRTRLLLEKLGRPQDALRFVHVAGTNGKGSTCAYIESILRCAGYRTGLFTSPYILCFEERIRVCGQNIPLDTLNAITLEVRDAALKVEAQLGEHPTEFELMTAVALCYFAQEKCDIVVLEVGLGGRLDSTNVIEQPEVCVITPIALDHTAVLGETLAEVAAEKSGILKPGVPVVSWPQELSAMEVVMARAEELGCPLTVMEPEALKAGSLTLTLASPACEDGGVKGEGRVLGVREGSALRLGESTPLRPFFYKGEPYETTLLGSYQSANAAMALEVVALLRRLGWDISVEAAQQGIGNAQWPGRFEVVATDPLTIVDGGHNPQGAQALVDSLQEVLAATGNAHATFVMGVLADKDYRAMIRTVAPLAERFFVYTPENPRALAADELALAIKEEAAASVAGVDVSVVTVFDAASALRQARVEAGVSGVAVAFGSLYAIANLMEELQDNC